MTPRGNFEHGTSVLRLARDIDDPPNERWAGIRERLLARRRERPQPGRDDKVVAAWCGLAVTGLAEFAIAFGGDDGPGGPAGERAVAVGRFLAEVHLVDGRLRRVSRDGVVGGPAGVLDDYGCVAEAFCALHQLTGEGSWLELAGGLLDEARAHFANPDGGFFDTADDAERLVARPADPTDNATPSGLSSLAAALVAYAALSGRTEYREVAERAIETVSPIIVRHPRYAGYASAVAEALVAGPYEIAIVGPEPGELVAAARRHAPPGSVMVIGEPDQPGVPLLEGRPAMNGQATAYVCRGFVCDRPVTTPEALVALLGGPST